MIEEMALSSTLTISLCHVGIILYSQKLGHFYPYTNLFLKQMNLNREGKAETLPGLAQQSHLLAEKFLCFPSEQIHQVRHAIYRSPVFSASGSFWETLILSLPRSCLSCITSKYIHQTSPPLGGWFCI